LAVVLGFHVSWVISVNLLRAFRAVLGTALFAISHTGCIERTAYNVIPDPWQVLYTTAAYKYHGMFLQLMAFTWDVGRDFDALVRRTRAILRNAELGFLGVIVRTTVHTPRFCGAPLACLTRRCL